MLPNELTGILRDQFYLHIPINNKICHIASLLMPTFLPIEGYLMNYLPKRGDIAIDAGAFPGNFTIILSRLVDRDGLVIAIEPDRESFNYLAYRFNRLSLKNINLLNCALWNADGKEEFRERSNEGSSLFNGEDKNHTPSNIIQTRRLDTIINELKISKVDYIKMDIEGAEIEALEGAAQVLKKHNPQLAIACYHLRNGKPTSFTLKEKLEELNYQVEIKFPQHLTLYGKKI